MSTRSPAKKTPRGTLRVAIVIAALGVAGMFTAAATFAGGEAGSEDGPSVAANVSR